MFEYPLAALSTPSWTTMAWLRDNDAHAQKPKVLLYPKGLLRMLCGAPTKKANVASIYRLFDDPEERLRRILSDRLLKIWSQVNEEQNTPEIGLIFSFLPVLSYRDGQFSGPARATT